MFLFRDLRVCWIVPIVQILCITYARQQSNDGIEDPEDDLDFNVDPNDFLDSLGSLADVLNDFGDMNGCTFICKNGATPQPKRNHKPRTNGCGSLGLQLDTSSVPAITKCCDEHDFCYDTCNNNKAKCDDDFKDCLNAVCDSIKRNGDEEDEVIEGCYSAAEVMYTGTMTLGCKPYKDSQKEACTCDHEEL